MFYIVGNFSLREFFVKFPTSFLNLYNVRSNKDELHPIGYLFANMLTGFPAVVLYCIYLVEADKKFKRQLLITVIICITAPTFLFGLYFISVNVFDLINNTLNRVSPPLNLRR